MDWSSGVRIAVTVVALGLGGCLPWNDSGSKSDEPTPRFALRGTLHTDQHAITDSDVNDPLAPYVNNDSPQRAQTLPNPFTLGGYLNLPQHGPSGDAWAVGDVIDVYKVDLVAGQTLTLTLGDDPARVDLDLLLLDAQMQIIDGALGTGRTESLTITEQHLEQPVYVAVALCGSNLHPCDGTAENALGASTYTLAASGEDASDAASLRLSDDFVAGDVIAAFAPSATPDVAGRRIVRPRTPRLTKIAPRTSVSPRALRATAALQHKLDTILATKALRRRADVAQADLNYIRRAQFTPNDFGYQYQWHYDAINLPTAWDVARAAPTSTDDVIVAVIDTGVLVDHPDLRDHIVPGYDFIADAANALDGNGLDPDGNDPGDKAWGSRSTFHGTHVAGTIAAATHNAIGGAGIAHARIMPLRVLGKNGGSSYDVMQAVLYAAGLENDSGTVPPRRADIINLSLGGGGYSQSEQDAFNRARAAGVIIIAAAGNNGASSVSYPAAYSGVVAVSAVDSKLARASYSNYGALVDVAAPGGSTQWDTNGDGRYDGIYSTSGNDYSGTVQYTYSIQTGTSMAAPHVAGVAALMKALKPQLSPTEFEALLVSGALTQDLGSRGRDNEFGYGMIDAYKAVAAATEGTVPSDPFAVAFPSALNLGALLTQATLVVGNGGGGTLRADLATADASWLRLDPQLDDNGLGSYRVSVDRSGLQLGTYTTTITIVSDANTLIVPVYMEVTSDSLAGDSARYQWIVLVDAGTGATVATTRAETTAYGHEFAFGDVEAGNYYVFAGTDLDNDSLICDAGEACGAFAPGATLVPVEVREKDIDGIDVRCAFGEHGTLPASKRPPLAVNGVSRMATRTAD